MSDQDQQELEQQIRAWVGRPPERSARIARTRVLASLEPRRSRLTWKLAAVATALALVLTSVALFRLSQTPSGPLPPVVADQPSSGLLVYELKSGTKLYLALGEAATADGVMEGS